MYHITGELNSPRSQHLSQHHRRGREISRSVSGKSCAYAVQDIQPRPTWWRRSPLHDPLTRDEAPRLRSGLQRNWTQTAGAVQLAQITDKEFVAFVLACSTRTSSPQSKQVESTRPASGDVHRARCDHSTRVHLVHRS